MAHCDDVGCLCGTEWSTAFARCANAILQCADGISSANSTLYCTDFPCTGCAKALVQAGVREVVFLSEYPDANSGIILRDGGIALFKAIPGDGEDTYRLVQVDIRGAKTQKA